MFDLNSAELAMLPDAGAAAVIDIATDVAPADRQWRFSDDQGAILARGHLIPDQAVYLLRCGFSHVEIERGTLAQ